jgi:FkbM family methyltransferase
MRLLKLFFADLIGIKKYMENFNRKTFVLFLKEPISMRKIILRLKGKFTLKDKKLLLTLGSGIVFEIKNSGMLDVICEIFAQDIYGYSSKYQHIVIDIGMNIGAASLFFASLENVKYIYAFEPFLQTFNNAMDNFNLNENLAKKIKAFNFGISDTDKTVTISYSEEDSAGMTIKKENIRDNTFSNKKKISSETVSVKSVDYIFNSLMPGGGNGTPKILLKVDCEGSEYEIFDIMDKKNYFKNIDMIMLEWHFNGNKSLLNILEKHGYSSFLRKCNENAGLIYAIKTNC